MTNRLDRKNKISRPAHLAIALGVLISMSCSHKVVRFRAEKPVWYFNDISPIPVPKDAIKDRLSYYATVQDPPPMVQPFYVTDHHQARDINSLDHVPASSWFMPRMGYQHITPEQLLFGPTELGPPRSPVQVLRVRDITGQPRLFVRDSRGELYLLKFDPRDFPALATTSSFIVNRLFWGFGYHVPEDHLYFFERKDLKISPESRIDNVAVDSLLTRIAPPVDHKYRALASRIIPGLPLGPTPERGIRPNDPNDYFAHQHRRVLRALRVFAAFVNMPDIGSDNTLDMYVGEPGKGYIKHYLVDFDDAFGTHAALYQRRWAGYNHIFSLTDIIHNFFTLGLQVHPWEYIRNTPWPSVGAFESTYFDPGKWKETQPFEPIRSSQPSDQYWAAKIIAHFEKAHLQKLITAAQYPSSEASDYILETCLARKQKILGEFFNRVSPVEFVQANNDTLFFKDIRKQYLAESRHMLTHYRIEIYDSKNEKIATHHQNSFYDFIRIPLVSTSKDYWVIKITTRDQKTKSESTAQFHFVNNEPNPSSLVGVIH